MPRLRIRVELPDVPGALAAAADALAGLGSDIERVDVLEVDGQTVVDEIVVTTADAVDIATVERVLAAAGALAVLSHTVDRPIADPVVSALELVREVLAAPTADERAERAGAVLARLAYADNGRLVPARAVDPHPMACRALHDGIPTAGRNVAGAAPAGMSGAWALWFAPVVARPRRVAVVTRAVNVRFSASEIARARAFLTLLEDLDTACEMTPASARAVPRPAAG